MQHLKNLLAGAAAFFGSVAPRTYPAHHGFEEDRRNLRSDWARTGQGLRVSLKSDARSRKRVQSTDAR